MVRLGATDVQSEDDVAGFNAPLPGRYHAVVNAVDESFTEYDKVVVEFAILNGTIPGQEQKTIREFFSVQGGDDKKTLACLKRLQRLALVLGLIQPGQEEEDVAFEMALGRQLVIEVEENNYEKDGQKKKNVRVAYMGFWSVWNPAVKDVPFDEEARKSVPVPAAFGGNGVDGPPQPAAPTPAPHPSSRARPAVRPAATAPAANTAISTPAAGDEWDDV